MEKDARTTLYKYIHGLLSTRQQVQCLGSRNISISTSFLFGDLRFLSARVNRYIFDHTALSIELLGSTCFLQDSFL